VKTIPESALAPTPGATRGPNLGMRVPLQISREESKIDEGRVTNKQHLVKSESFLMLPRILVAVAVAIIVSPKNFDGQRRPKLPRTPLLDHHGDSCLSPEVNLLLC
jgi:hypothetical protein